jgi:hypothetical protein
MLHVDLESAFSDILAAGCVFLSSKSASVAGLTFEVSTRSLWLLVF